MPSISVLTKDGKLLKVEEANYCSIGDAAGDIDGGDFWDFLKEAHPEVKYKDCNSGEWSDLKF